MSIDVFPTIIQGGLGVGVSNWRLARAVSAQGQLGVVSGTALDQVLVRRLQDGDPDGAMRAALDQFPYPEMVERIWKAYFIPGGKPSSHPYALAPMQMPDGPREFRELCVVSNFAEVFLARQGHANPVGINYMEKLQIPHLPSIYGAMLAGVDYILMGAGIPMRVPGILDCYVRHEPASYPLHAVGAEAEDDTLMHFDPRELFPEPLPALSRPRFLAIVSSSALATSLARKANGKVDGFVIEGFTAGGHNAPPRGKLTLNEQGEPVYGDRDRPDLAKFRELGLPFWLAGGFGSAAGLREALAQGATGIQAGTAFAFCDESAMQEAQKQAVIGDVLAGTAHVFTDASASPTGFPFKVVERAGTVSEEEVFRARPRVCDLGYLREAYLDADRHVRFRCPSEAESVYASKGGDPDASANRKCICNGLLAAIGQPQRRGSYEEPCIITAGDDLTNLGQFLAEGETTYSAADVIRCLLDPGVTIEPKPAEELVGTSEES